MVFANNGLSRLMSRITELHQEKAHVHQNYRKLKRDFVLRNKDKKQAEKQIEDLQRKFDDIQLLKFGQVRRFAESGLRIRGRVASGIHMRVEVQL